MVLDLRRIFEIPGERQECDYEIPVSVADDYKKIDLSVPISVKGVIKNKSGVISLDYKADYRLRHKCDRCLIEFERDYAVSCNAVVVKSLSSEDNDDYIVVGGNELDLDEHIISDLILHFPSKVLCKEDCKGLCQFCGADLNETVCSCQK
ncbi:MAG: YceD family protein [Oscillospiraceae bacterium]